MHCLHKAFGFRVHRLNDSVDAERVVGHFDNLTFFIRLCNKAIVCIHPFYARRPVITIFSRRKELDGEQADGLTGGDCSPRHQS
jgi:hypothetical protein